MPIFPEKNRTTWLTIALSLYAVLILGSMATMSIGIGVVLLGLVLSVHPKMLWSRFRAELRLPSTRRYLALTVALSFACLLSLVVAHLHPLSYNGKTPQIHFGKDLVKAWYFFWPLILVPALRILSQSQRRNIILTWITTFGALSVVGIVQYYTGWPRPQMIPGNEPYYHATLFAGHHLSVASIMIFPFFVTLDLTRQKGFSKKILIPVLALGLLMLIATYSRMLWLSLPVGILLWLLWIMPRRWVLPSLMVFSLAIMGLTQLNFVKNRMESSMGISERTTLWRINTEFFKARPWTGAGWHHNLELSGYYQEEKGKPGEPIFSGHAHSNFFEVLGSLGLIGMLCWLAWSFYVIALPFTYRNTSEAIFARGIVCAWIVFFLNGLTQVNFWESKVIHSMMWMVAWSLLWAGENAEKIKPRLSEFKA